MPTRPPPPRNQPTRFALAALLAVALALASFLGVVHRVAHAPLDQLAASAVAPDADNRASWSKRLFDAHRDAGSCNLYDQLTQGAGAPTTPAVAVALVASERLFFAHDASVVAAPREAVRARGPPTQG